MELNGEEPKQPMSWTEKIEDQWRKTKEHAETYPYVWASYIFVHDVPMAEVAENRGQSPSDATEASQVGGSRGVIGKKHLKSRFLLFRELDR
ncbi:hypothetical protein H6P81_020801 [Aristolochia fimbriata]|uniref:Uncharacterized protein n=1 Tax=Aristolochia fimbriata TaxID=158543 RepID=A0AAV7DYM4_ARIFI|nr:hypothetical protein H6P81_020801 [Aristolochia fimbriata]